MARLEILAEQGSIKRVDTRVVDWMISAYASQLLWADNEHLARLYKLAAAAPLTTTRTNLEENDGLKFDGLFPEGSTIGRYAF